MNSSFSPIITAVIVAACLGLIWLRPRSIWAWAVVALVLAAVAFNTYSFISRY